MQQFYITAQKSRFRGECLPPIRVSGKQFVFKWDKAFDSYAIPMASQKAANELLLILYRKHSFLFLPGIAFRDVDQPNPSTPDSTSASTLTSPALETPAEPKKRMGRPRKEVLAAA